MQPKDYDLQPLPGHASREAGSFVAQLDDQNRRLLEDLRGCLPAELEWQPAAGMNTIGMLLAHIAIVEVYWLSVATGQPFDTDGILGIGRDDDGLPIPEGGGPPASISGRPLEFFEDLLTRARANTKRIVPFWSDSDLDVRVERTRRDGQRSIQNRRWILYHVLEHEAGHYGQINLLRHHHRISGRQR